MGFKLLISHCQIQCSYMYKWHNKRLGRIDTPKQIALDNKQREDFNYEWTYFI